MPFRPLVGNLHRFLLRYELLSSDHCDLSCDALRLMEVTNEEHVVRAFADICKADDDSVVVTNDQDSQCKNLLQRLPPEAKVFMEREGLVGKGGGSFSMGANGPPGPKD